MSRRVLRAGQEVVRKEDRPVLVQNISSALLRANLLTFFLYPARSSLTSFYIETIAMLVNLWSSTTRKDTKREKRGEKKTHGSVYVCRRITIWYFLTQETNDRDQLVLRETSPVVSFPPLFLDLRQGGGRKESTSLIHTIDSTPCTGNHLSLASSYPYSSCPGSCKIEMHTSPFL